MTKLKWVLSSSAAILVGAAAISMLPAAGHAQDRAAPTFSAADPNLQGDGTMSPAAAAAKARGALRLPADEALKAAANSASSTGDAGPAGAGGADGAAGPSSNAAAIVGGHNFAGQNSVNSSPTDSTGAIGSTRYIQLINSIARIYNRSTHAIIGSGTLNQLGGMASTVNSFDPQIIWDAQTNKFHYAMDSIISSSDHKLSVGFSKNSSPVNLTTDWCHYVFNYGSFFPDYPKLGDSQFFTIIGVNTFNPSVFVGSDILAQSKPTAANITTCPAASSFRRGSRLNIRDTNGFQVFTPVPSQQVDNNPTGYVVTRNGGLPSNRLWFFNVTRNPTTLGPVFGNARGVTVPSYAVPPDAAQPTFSQRLDTLDTRPTQAVQAINPNRGAVHSFYTQHTIANGSFSQVRWYEINPAPATPVLLRVGNLAATNSFIFNGAISPDRKRAGTSTVASFGNSFVENHSASSSVNNISPRIVAGSSLNGALVGGFLTVVNGVGPYRDFTCPNPGNTCRWGDYAAATPDPLPVPTTAGRGVVWGTNMFSGVVNPSPGAANGRTRIFAHQP